MKVCPNCQRNYTDDNLNFCLDDGAILTQSSINDSLPETVMISQPKQTNPQTTFGNQSNQPANWNNPANYSMQPQKKSSKTWIWVVGVLGLVVLLCGGGFVGFVAWVGTLDLENTNTSKTPSNTTTVSTPVKATPDDRKNVQKINLEKWAKGDNEYGITEFKDGEFFMSARKKGFYYVLVAPEEYKTESATTKVSVRNVKALNNEIGFGLIIHSNPTPLQKDYAFLIDSEKRKYKIVTHSPGNEKTVVNWTNANSIKNGTQENILEARDDNGQIDFYINGTQITSIRNTEGYKGGVAGVYSGDGIQIAFSNLEIRK